MDSNKSTKHERSKRKEEKKSCSIYLFNFIMIIKMMMMMIMIIKMIMKMMMMVKMSEDAICHALESGSKIPANQLLLPLFLYFLFLSLLLLLLPLPPSLPRIHFYFPFYLFDLDHFYLIN